MPPDSAQRQMRLTASENPEGRFSASAATAAASSERTFRARARSAESPCGLERKTFGAALEAGMAEERGDMPREGRLCVEKTEIEEHGAGWADGRGIC